jgi:hypothetical protein
MRSAIALEFYRPAARPDPRPKKQREIHANLQMTFDFEKKSCPLIDVFPEAYE